MLRGLAIAFALLAVILGSLPSHAFSEHRPPPSRGALTGSPQGFVAGRGQRPEFSPNELIVRLASDGAGSVTSLAAEHGVAFKEKLLLPNYAVVSVPAGSDVAAVAGQLNADSRVASVERNAYHYLDFHPNDTYYGYQWQFPQIQMPEAWDISTGSGVVVAVVDSGVAYENYGQYARAPDLASTEFVAGWDFANNDAHPNDDMGHGTHVAGTIAQSTNNGLGTAGIAFNANIMPVKVANAEGQISLSNEINGITWAADNGAKVINLSLGGPTYSSALENAVNYAHNKGVVLVASAGNDGAGTVDYPAAYRHVISVGATRYDQTRTWYSNYGSRLDLVAPGGDTWIDQNGDGYSDGILQQTFCNPDWDPKHCNTIKPGQFAYYFLQGTSMAAPHVSGAAALLLAQRDGTPDQVRQALQSSAKDLGASGWDFYYGYGLVQARSALAVWQPGSLGVSTNNVLFLLDPDSGPETASVRVAITATSQLSWTAGKSADSWLSIVPSTGSGPGELTITANKKNAGNGKHNGNVTITSTGAAGSPQEISVQLYVGAVSRVTLPQAVKGPS